MAYTVLWQEVAGRLNEAFGLMQADDPALAARTGAALREWLAHNELELALDELLNNADDAGAVLRRRFWEALLTAAMLMRLTRHFLRLAGRIPDLEPHVFGSHIQPPRVWCDFNGFVEADTYSLNSVGTALDFARLRLVPSVGLIMDLYDGDENDDGKPSWLLARAEIVQREPWGLVAAAAPAACRWELR